MSGIHFESTYDNSKLINGIRQDNMTVAQWAKNASASGETVTQMFNRVQAAAAGYLSLRFASQLGSEIIKVRGEFQQLGIAFETMLGSKAAADKLMQEAIVFAQKTPFTLTDVATNIKQLMAMGIETEKVMDTMKALGDVAAGVSVPISRIAINYGQVAALGKLQSRELRDFALAGIPLLDELANNLGKSKSEIQDMVTAGQIGFKEVEQAFAGMAGEGGKFYNLMEKQNASVTGQISNLQDKIQVMLNSLGQANEGLIYSGISGAARLVENYEKVINVLQGIAITYGTYKAAVIAVNVVESYAATVDSARLAIIEAKTAALQKEMVMNRLSGSTLVAKTAAANVATAAEIRQYLATNKLTAAQALLNRTMLANPYVLAAVGVGVLITALVSFGKKVKTTQDHVDGLNKSIDQIGKQQEINGAIKKYKELSEKQERSKDEQDELNKTIEHLSSIFPDAIGKTDQYGKAVDLVTDKLLANNEALRENIKITTGSEVESASKKIELLIAKRDKLLNEINTGESTIEVVTSAGPQGVQTASQQVNLSDKAIEEKRKQVNDLSDEISQLGHVITEGNRKLSELGKISDEQALAPFKGLFKEVSEYTEAQMLDTKAKLTELLGQGFSAEAETKIKNQIDAIAEKLSLPTVKEQIEEVSKSLQEAEKKLKEMRSSSSQSTKEEIEEQEGAIDDLTKSLETLTGIKKKDAKSTQDIIDQLKKDLETADVKDKNAIADKIIELERELQLRKDIAQQELKIARNRELKPNKLDTSSINGTITSSDGKPLFIGKDEYQRIQKVNLELPKLQKRINDGAEHSKDLLDDIKKSLHESSDVFGALGYAAGAFDEELGASLTKMADITYNASNLVENLGKGGDKLTAITSIIALAGNFLELFEKPNQTDYLQKLNDQISATNRLYGMMEKLLVDLSGTEYFEESKEQLEIYNQELEKNWSLLKQYKNWTLSEISPDGTFVKVDTSDFNLNDWVKFLDRLKQDSPSWINNPAFKAVELYISQIIELDEKINETKTNIGQKLTDLSFESAKDSFKDFLMDVDTDIEDVANNFNRYMRKSIISLIVDDTLKGRLQEWYQTFQDYMNDGTLEGWETEELERMYTSAYNEGVALRDAAFSAAGLTPESNDGSSSSGLVGSIRRDLSEETGGELAGILRKYADDTRLIRDYTKDGITHLILIEAYTLRTAEATEAALLKLETIVTNTSQQPSSWDLGV